MGDNRHRLLRPDAVDNLDQGHDCAHRIAIKFRRRQADGTCIFERFFQRVRHLKLQLVFSMPTPPQQVVVNIIQIRVFQSTWAYQRVGAFQFQFVPTPSRLAASENRGAKDASVLPKLWSSFPSPWIRRRRLGQPVGVDMTFHSYAAIHVGVVAQL